MVLSTVDHGGSRDVVPKVAALQLPATVSSHSLSWLDPFDARLEMGAPLEALCGDVLPNEVSPLKPARSNSLGSQQITIFQPEP